MMQRAEFTLNGGLDEMLSRVRQAPATESRGRVVQLTGLVIESEGPLAAVGELCRIESVREGESTLAEVVGFRNHHLLLMPLGEIHGIHPGSAVTALGAPLQVAVGQGLRGRVIDALGQPLDEGGPLVAEGRRALSLQPPHPLKRQRILDRFHTGVRCIDTFTPCGRGQRLGIFAGSGVGKSTLLGMIARQAEAEVNVIALIGERGREVREFLEKDLGEEGRRKSVVVVATSDQPALVRLKGAFLAMAVAEHFRDQGSSVMFMMDSVTRFAMAQREIGLAVGEPPATRGYTPSVFSLLPLLLERAGMGAQGSITGLFTVLVESDDMDDPIADAVRSILDGHIVLTRELAMRNHYPAIDVLASVSRLERDLLKPAERDLVARAREALALYLRNQDLINIGAYPAGSNPAIDRAICWNETLTKFLRQGVEVGVSVAEAWAQLEAALRAQPAPHSKSSGANQPSAT